MARSISPFGDDGLALFPRDFDDPADMDGVLVLDDAEHAEAVSEVPPPITADMLAQACEAAREEGLHLGRAEAAAAREAMRDAMTANLLAALRDADSSLREAAEDAGSHLAFLVLSMLRAGFPAIYARHGAVEFARFTRAVVGLLEHEPRIVIRVHPSLLADLDEILAELEPERRAAILVEPFDMLPPGDARIAWHKGLATRDTASMRRRVDEILAPLGLAPDDTDLVDASSSLASPQT